MRTSPYYMTSEDFSVYERWTDGSRRHIRDSPSITLIHDVDRTYALPKEPRRCGVCGAMSGVFINRAGETACGRCDAEDRLRAQTRAGHAARAQGV